MATTPWTAPTIRPLSDAAAARFGAANFYDGQGYESSLPDFGS